MYDIELRYPESERATGKGWIRGVEVQPGRLLRLRVAIAFAVGRVKIADGNVSKDILLPK